MGEAVNLKGGYRFGDDDGDRALANRLSQKLRLPGRVIVFSPTDSFRALARKLSRVPCIEVFRRGN